jgi:hypothetical protein
MIQDVLIVLIVLRRGYDLAFIQELISCIKYRIPTVIGRLIKRLPPGTRPHPSPTSRHQSSQAITPFAPS